MPLKLSRSQITAVLAALLVLLAGCSSLGGSGGETPTETDATTEEETMSDETTESEMDTNTTSGDSESELSGRMLVVVEGQEKHLDTEPGAKFSFNETNEHTWTVEEPMTLAEALETANVTAEPDSLTIDGETYNESDTNTTITYQVAGTEIEDPSEYTLEDMNPAHELVVRVDDHDQEVPGRLVEQSHPHPHGRLNMTVDGEPVDFTQEKYVMAEEAFHFHGDENAARWHGHSLNLTAAYALSTFPGMNVSEDAMTYNGTTYMENGSETSFTVTVDGEEVDPNTYVLKDGDSIEVTLNESDDSTVNEASN
ncbi:hypothetical protein EGH21_14785 [Halomicroarcula sp. F13]|uniref:DUF4382 domain-containing protein n=1 Tax=Haloarcula rubra TaxID=2487747 RepID=A0AAW4PRT2_9EURY|nr:hypothetical protein [Halomicroarcula rubra]MBX0324293.1 hypothetical protein [Halomicroarcula rubra]